ncbi:cubilin [Aplysia californica]|uniref:Cubilin n=1 Tax=Aplysia californica TaxID=6500 RepID=A0ABM1AEP0_APLCA|nr:cubilin [Aplysia californica]
MIFGYYGAPTNMASRLEVQLFALIYILLMCLSVDVVGQHDCDKVFSSYHSKEKNGTFESPGHPSHYPNGVSCKYKFIGQSNERVEIQFTSFALQGRPPRCTNDFVTIYSQLEHESDDLLEAKDTGPFCGEAKEDLPDLVVSTKNILVIWFYSNHEKSRGGFQGKWAFINAIHEEMGTVAPRMCGYTVRSENKVQGYIMSPTYPGAYPDNQYCFYKLQGKPGERIRLTFEDFSLFYGGEYCPFDYLRIFDGYTNTARVIGTFCGTYNQTTVIYSTGEALLLHFSTGEGRLSFKAPPMEANADFKFPRKGFNISYVFSDSFVSLDEHFVLEGAEHVLGTQCDLRILSGKETDGTFVSPSYPALFQEGVVCRYYLDGLMDDQNLEKVKVEFFDFNIPGNMPYCLLGYLAENEDGRLNGGRVKHKYCGTTIRPPPITSVGPRMVITLNTTGAVRGGKFVARYKFITDYGIPGDEIEEGKCQFHYNSAKTKMGETNSPRHPGSYPLNLDCEYIFRPRSNEVVIITFSVFKLSDPKGIDCNNGDYVAFHEDLGTSGRKNFTLTERYCGEAFPGPYATSRLLKMLFHSDDRDTNVGFKAYYKFVDKQIIEDSSCVTNNINARGSGGIIISPNYPRKYPPLKHCEWIIHASKREHKILVEIVDLNMEGTYQVDGATSSSCQAVVLRLFADSTAPRPLNRLCGKQQDPAISQSYVSIHDSFKISFLTSETSLGAKGFKISWTEIHVGPSATMECSGFKCRENKYCISPKLKCNGEPNCGKGDNSDETAECPNSSGPKSSGIQILHIAIGTSISSFFCIILLICGFYHRRKFRTERAPPDHDHVEVRYVSAPTGCNTTDRLLMDDRNDHGNDHHNNSTTQSPRCQKVSMV